MYEAILTLVIISNFFQATIQDPGKIPRGKWPTCFGQIDLSKPQNIYRIIYYVKVVKHGI